jgi:hypothetical protein
MNHHPRYPNFDDLFTAENIFFCALIVGPVLKPGNILARANLFSNYKHHHTIKYLIAMSPVGHIAFVSKSYGGRCSDKLIFESCGILDLIKEDDIVLCDRGFLVEQAVTDRKARLITPSFKKGRSQMQAMEVERNREISAVRVHVERMIGKKNSFKNFQKLNDFF